MAGESFLELVRQYGRSYGIDVTPSRAWYESETETVTLRGKFTKLELEMMALAMRELSIRKHGPSQEIAL